MNNAFFGITLRYVANVQIKDSLRQAVRALFVFTLATNVLLLSVPMHMLQVYDRVLTSGSVETLIYLTLIVILALGAYAVAEAIRGRLAQRLSNQFMVEHSEEVLNHLVYSKDNSANANKVLRDLNTLRQYISSRQFIGLFDLPFFPVFLVLMFILHITLGFVALAGICAMVFIAVLNNRSTEAARAASQAANNEAIAFSQATLRRAEDIRAMGLLPAILKRWGTKTAEALSSADASTSHSSKFYGASRMVRQSLQVLSMAWGAFLVLNGDMSGGMIFAASMLLGKTLTPIEQLIGGWDQAISNLNAYRTITDLAEQSRNQPRLTQLPAPDGHLSVEALVYSASEEPSARPILNGVTFNLAPGEILGVIGPSGGGKSTLARLIVGAISPSSGVIRLDKFDLEQWPEAQRGRYIGYVPQDIVLFPGTIAENIARLDPDASDHQIVEAARKAGVHDMIAGLANGYSTEIGPEALPLSGGQRQRIALARAFYSTPRLLVLDEPNAHLDQDGETLLMDALLAARADNVAILIVSQRNSIQKIADRLMVVENGVVTAIRDNQEFAEKPAGATGSAPAHTPPPMPDELVRRLREMKKAADRPDDAKGAAS